MHRQENWFRYWFNSPYYHLLYADRNETEAEDFINHLIDHLKPTQGDAMLDVACGRGRHAKILAEKGFDVTGIDLSPASIEYALQFETDHLHFYEHDMRMLFWINYFDYAFNFFTSFGYFATEREHDNALRTISQSLKKGGVFMLDYINAHLAEKSLIPEMTKEVNGVTFRVSKKCDDNYFYKKIIIEDKNLDQPLMFTECIRKFTLEDFTSLFAKQQLTVIAVFGNYKLEPFNKEKSPRLILVARKD